MVYVHTMETPADAMDKGKMRINVYDKQQGTPLADARISLAYTGNPERIINEITTDSEGAVNLDDLLTPLRAEADQYNFTHAYLLSKCPPSMP